MVFKVELDMIGYLPKSVSPSLKSLAAIRPVSPWAFLLPHLPKLLNCWPVFWALDGLESPDKRLPTWFNWDEGFVLKCWLDGAETNWVKPLLVCNSSQKVKKKLCVLRSLFFSVPNCFLTYPLPTYICTYVCRYVDCSN